MKFKLFLSLMLLSSIITIPAEAMLSTLSFCRHIPKTRACKQQLRWNNIQSNNRDKLLEICENSKSPVLAAAIIDGNIEQFNHLLTLKDPRHWKKATLEREASIILEEVRPGVDGFDAERYRKRLNDARAREGAVGGCGRAGDTVANVSLE